MFLYSFITAARENLSSWTVNVSQMMTVHLDAKTNHCFFFFLVGVNVARKMSMSYLSQTRSHIENPLLQNRICKSLSVCCVLVMNINWNNNQLEEVDEGRAATCRNQTRVDKLDYSALWRSLKTWHCGVSALTKTWVSGFIHVPFCAGNEQEISAWWFNTIIVTLCVFIDVMLSASLSSLQLRRCHWAQCNDCFLFFFFSGDTCSLIIIWHIM